MWGACRGTPACCMWARWSWRWWWWRGRRGWWWGHIRQWGRGTSGPWWAPHTSSVTIKWSPDMIWTQYHQILRVMSPPSHCSSALSRKVKKCPHLRLSPGQIVVTWISKYLKIICLILEIIITVTVMLYSPGAVEHGPVPQSHSPWARDLHWRYFLS